MIESFLKLRGLVIGTNPVTSLALSTALMLIGTVLIFLPLRSVVLLGCGPMLSLTHVL